MKVIPEMKVKDALRINERMMDAFIWLAPEFKRLRNPVLRKAMAGRVNIEQAARIARVPLQEALYLLNLTAGESELKLTAELRFMNKESRRYVTTNKEPRPGELEGLRDDDGRVHFVDLVPLADQDEDPRPAVMRGLTELHATNDVLLLRHRFDPIPLRDLFKRRGFESWAELRRPQEWFIYFYRPGVKAGAIAQPPMSVGSFFHAASAGN